MDTSAFIAGFDPLSTTEEHYTVPMVEAEIYEESISDVRFRMAVQSGKLNVRIPNSIFLDKVKASATLVGDAYFLSETDLQVLALALELRSSGYSPLIITDDYSIQNVANEIGIQFSPLVTFGIRKRLHWTRYCPACRKKYSADSKQKACLICGTELKRKPIRKNDLNISDLKEKQK